MKPQLLKEITPLNNGDCFTLFSRVKNSFDFPLHYHEEFELNFIYNAKGVKRVIGDHIAEIDDLELVLVGPNLPHVWQTHKCTSKEITEVTIQFHKDLFDEKLLQRNQLGFIRSMLEKSYCGISFAPEIISHLKPRLLQLEKKEGFDSVLELLSILNELSLSRNKQTLSAPTFNKVNISQNSRRIQEVYKYMNQHFDKPISLYDVAQLANMTEISFSRFFKAKTGITFIDSLSEIRLGHASRMLIDTSHSIAEIAYKCGFNNISNFNRVFKKKKTCTPKEFRESYSIGNRIFI